MSLLHIAMQRSHGDLALNTLLTMDKLREAAKRGRSPIKNVLGLNVHQVSSCWEHAKGLATMIFFLAMLPCYLSSFSLASS